jgi:hypothetical protein
MITINNIERANELEVAESKKLALNPSVIVMAAKAINVEQTVDFSTIDMALTRCQILAVNEAINNGSAAKLKSIIDSYSFENCTIKVIADEKLRLFVDGNSYAAKESIKAAGFKWSGVRWEREITL